MDLVLIATSWGSEAGGINVFNRELAGALAAEHAGRGRVFCALPTTATPVSVETFGVEIIPLNEISPGAAEDEQLRLLAEWRRGRDPGDAITWIGHDVITGPLAVRAADEIGGASVVIHHMSYAAYDLFKGGSSAAVDKRVRAQRDLLRSAGKVLAVGPLLRRSAAELTRRTVIELVPGFPSFKAGVPSENAAFTAITFGRMSRQDGRIKQGRLAVAAFGHAVGKAAVNNVGLRRLAHPRPRLYVVGLDGDVSEEHALRDLAEQEAGRAVTVFGLPYDVDRDELLDRVRSADLALMLSWHEGFGLAGWEAIAAGVPLILTKHSGLFELIERELSDAGLACVQVVDVEGRSADDDGNPFTERDKDKVSAAILAIGADPARARTNAETLHRLLSESVDGSWRSTARTLLQAIGEKTKQAGRGSFSKTDDTIARHDPEAVSELKGRLGLGAWAGLTHEARLATCREIEARHSGALRLQRLQSYAVGDARLPDVPTFLHTLSGIELQLVLGGVYAMGDADGSDEFAWCRNNYPDWREDWSMRSTPQHQRSVQPYFLGRFPVLQDDWDRFKADEGLRDKRSDLSPRNPIDGVSWQDLQRYLRTAELRLPSEAEWEWACNAGAPTRFYWGDEMDSAYCWHQQNSLGGIHAVDEHLDRPNLFGLIDMLGNVWEWSADDWADRYDGAPGDGSPRVSPTPERYAAQRGGGWNNWPATCRTRFRSPWPKEDRIDNTGFRVAKSMV